MVGMKIWKFFQDLEFIIASKIFIILLKNFIKGLVPILIFFFLIKKKKKKKKSHILQQTFADPPWNSQVREQVSLLMNFLEEQIRQQQQEIDELEKKEQDRIDAARRRVEELEREKLRLEQELLALRKKGTFFFLTFNFFFFFDLDGLKSYEFFFF